MRRKLLPRARGLFRSAELWLEDDRLLYVSSSRFADKYVRFRLSDIQALVCTQFALWTPGRTLWVGSSVFLTTWMLSILPGRHKWWSLPFAVSLAFAVADVLRGPRCRVVFHTAVSTVTIDAIRTIAAARLILPELRSLIEGTQGQSAGDGQAVLAAVPRPDTAAAAANPSLLLPRVLFGVLAAHAALLGILYATNQMDTGLMLSATLLIAELILGILGVLRWRTVGLAALCAVTAACALADGGVLAYSFFQTFRIMFEEAQRGNRMDQMEVVWLREQTMVRTIWHALFGIVGWAMLWAARDKRT